MLGNEKPWIDKFMQHLLHIFTGAPLLVVVVILYKKMALICLPLAGFSARRSLIVWKIASLFKLIAFTAIFDECPRQKILSEYYSPIMECNVRQAHTGRKKCKQKKFDTETHYV